MINIKDPEKSEKFRKYALENLKKLNLIIGAILIFSIVLYFSFIKPSTDPLIFDKLKNDSKELNTSINKFQNKFDTLK